MRIWPKLRKEEKGIAAVEFAVIAPVFFMLIMGGMDIGYTLYVQSVMNGEIQKAARDATLENGTETAIQTAIDTKVRDALLNLNKSATITIDRQSYSTFTQAQAQQPEDSNQNGVCETGETWVDANFNGVYDATGGNQGQGGAKDVVVYSVNMTYQRLFPLTKLIGLPSTVDITSRTVLANQPYGDQQVPTGSLTPQACP
ncbi:MAG: TadE/TadG family type IV pilus assembly protein [Sphingobium sp.]|nr:pilus assembly protein [Sphingobium sp.]MCP5398732.1 pilus assembly protein [Sphingomonas sp.]